MTSNVHSSNLVSVIIPCFNHGQYLVHAIESVLKQSYKYFEIIVVDDGSTDNSKYVAESFSTVNYVYQENKGLSAARNKGIDCSKGEFLVFLDADDWLFEDALKINIKYLRENEKAAFVSGAHQKINNDGKILEDGRWRIQSNHYQQLLDSNYIGMHATVMYRRWIFDIFRYDVSLGACEDYDLYLKITRKYPVVHHEETTAAYRIHDSNMSSNIPLMLTTAITVLRRQRGFLTDENEIKIYEEGLKKWKKYYGDLLYGDLLFKPFSYLSRKRRELATLRKFRPKLYLNILSINLLMSIKNRVNRIYRALFVPAVGQVHLGDFNRKRPFSNQFGYDRGGPVDRYYIENFLRQHQDSIKGDVLEIGDNDYTLLFGGSRVKKSDILHIDEKNPKATYIGDLSDIPKLPDNNFDCIVLTQTLHLIYHINKAVQTCYRVLKPGGVLLITVPGISHIDQGDWKKNWLWSFTEASITRILSEVFPLQNMKVETFGNVFVATAFLYGMGLPELKKEQLDFHDPHYQLVITAFAQKPG